MPAPLAVTWGDGCFSETAATTGECILGAWGVKGGGSGEGREGGVCGTPERVSPHNISVSLRSSRRTDSMAVQGESEARDRRRLRALLLMLLLLLFQLLLRHRRIGGPVGISRLRCRATRRITMSGCGRCVLLCHVLCSRHCCRD